MTRLRDYFDNSALGGHKTNTVLGGIIASYLFANCVNILFDGNLTWSLYGFSVLILVFLPVIILRNPYALIPFEILLLLAFPFTIKGMELGFMASHTLNYLSASAIGLLLVTELDTFTDFKATADFTTVLVGFSTISVAGIWAVVRWLSDIYRGTQFIVSENALMWEFFAATMAGIIGGFIFQLYFKQRDKEVRREIEN